MAAVGGAGIDAMAVTRQRTVPRGPGAAAEAGGVVGEGAAAQKVDADVLPGGFGAGAVAGADVVPVSEQATSAARRRPWPSLVELKPVPSLLATSRSPTPKRSNRWGRKAGPPTRAPAPPPEATRVRSAPPPRLARRTRRLMAVLVVDPARRRRKRRR